MSDLIILWFDDAEEWSDVYQTLQDLGETTPGINLVIRVDYPHVFNDHPDDGDYAVFVWGETAAINAAVAEAKAEASHA